tara:strand:- start:897 stop:1124 length:228 start_codon:yes stop_codon:yes gene_type:complete
MAVSKETMKPIVQMLEESLVKNEQAQEKLQLEYRTLTDKMNQLYEMHQELVQLRDAFYRYAKFITPEKEQVNNVN